MSIFAISDLHLSLSGDKPMDIFRGWDNHTQRLTANWRRLVRDDDTVVLPGDFCWALKTENAVADFKFIENLPGKKILLKGNHDLWWSTAKKLKEFFAQNNINSVDFIYNNSIVCEGFALAGTRGWFYDNTGSKKVLMREAGRLEASLKAAKETGLPILTFLHYPPVYGDFVCNEILDVLKRYNITTVYYGHIHGAGHTNPVKSYDGIDFRLISCDLIEFCPQLVAEKGKIY